MTRWTILAGLLALAAGCYYPMDRAGYPESPPPPAYSQPPLAPAQPPAYYPQPSYPPPPTTIVILDHDPDEVWFIPETRVYYVPHVSAEVFFFDGRWYTRSGAAWYWSFEVRGPWTFLGVEEVPPAVRYIPPDYRQRYQTRRIPYLQWKLRKYQWDEERPAPPPPPPPPPPPVIIDRDPDEVWFIPGSRVYFLPNLDVDIFFFGGRWYTRVGIDWSWGPDYRGPWHRLRAEEVPPSIRELPRDYRHRYQYRRVPYGQWKQRGYHWEDEDEGDRDRGEGRREDRHREGPPPAPPPPAYLPPPVVIDRDPDEVWLIRRTGVFFLPGVAFDLFFNNGRWYYRAGGQWYWGPAFRGPWTWLRAEEVPDPVRGLPPDFRQKVKHQPVPYGQWKQRGYTWKDDEEDQPKRDIIQEKLRKK